MYIGGGYQVIFLTQDFVLVGISVQCLLNSGSTKFTYVVLPLNKGHLSNMATISVQQGGIIRNLKVATTYARFVYTCLVCILVGGLILPSKYILPCRAPISSNILSTSSSSTGIPSSNMVALISFSSIKPLASLSNALNMAIRDSWDRSEVGALLSLV